MATPLFELLGINEDDTVLDEAYGEKLPRFIRDVQTDLGSLDQAAWFDFSFHGRIKMSGKHSLDFLQRLSTNDVLKQAGNTGVTILTNEKGRLIDVLTIVTRSDHFLLLTSAGSADHVMKWLDRYIIMEDVKLENITHTTSQIHIFGLKTLPEDPVLKDMTVFPVMFGEGDTGIIADRSVSGLLLSYLKNHAVVPIGLDAVEIRRIEKKRPLYRREITDKYNPIEIGLSPFISFTKGCYIGQEVIARLDSYDKVQRRLLGLQLTKPDDRVTPPVSFENPKVGEISSLMHSPKNGQWSGLAIVKKEFTSQKEIAVLDSALHKFQAVFS